MSCGIMVCPDVSHVCWARNLLPNLCGTQATCAWLTKGEVINVRLHVSREAITLVAL